MWVGCVHFIKSRDAINRVSTFYQSPSSRKKMSSTGLLNTRAIFKASTVDGTYLFASIALMVWRLTEIRLANSSWVRLWIARSTLILFVIGHGFGASVQDVVEADDKNDQDGKHVVDHDMQERQSIDHDKRHQQQDVVCPD